MAKNVWDATLDVNNDVKKNSFDWSNVYNFTGGIGKMYPCFSELAPANSTVRINPTFGLQLMPSAFPFQTDTQVRLSFFRYPLRALWNGYTDYIGGFKQGLEAPYMDFKNSFEETVGVGKLADYLKIPVVQVGAYGDGEILDFSSPVAYGDFSGTLNSFFGPGRQFDQAFYGVIQDLPSDLQPTDVALPAQIVNPSSAQSTITIDVPDGCFYESQYLTIKTVVSFLGENNEILSSSVLYNSPLNSTAGSQQVTMPFGAVPFDVSIPLNAKKVFFGFSFAFSTSNTLGQLSDAWHDEFFPNVSTTLFPFSFYMALNGETPVTFEVREITRETSPYYDSSRTIGREQIKLAAYKFRAYEGIYNAYYRDMRNNPFILNGQEEYNVWLPTYEGGADTTIYKLHSANWERDMFTTAVPSPQQGRAPLVGLTTYTDTTQLEDGSYKTALKLALVDEDGKRYAVNVQSNETGVTGVEYGDLSDAVGLAPVSMRSLVDAASTGISIPDLRIVNAYQKYLELNMRKSYTYKQIIEGRFDCKVRYDDLLMPEFIGGMTRPIRMNRVTQTVEVNGDGSYAGALGSLAGDASCFGDGGSTISCFCDEESIIMGIIMVVPKPVYTQVLPKDFLYRDVLDHFQPEFNYLGFQPITKAELCPVQAWNAGENLNDVFGYQRPWYEYVSKLDTAHGLFLTQMRNFLMHRVFNEVPALNEAFLLVDENQVNQVFSVTEITDKVYGQIAFQASAELPIARVAIPRLD